MRAVPAHLRDTLLRLADRGLDRALWSADIIDELRRNLIADGFQPVSVDHLLGEMGAAFPDAEVSGYRPLIDGLALTRQAAANRRQPKTLPRLLDALTKAGASSFADELRRRAGADQDDGRDLEEVPRLGAGVVVRGSLAGVPVPDSLLPSVSGWTPQIPE